MRAIIYEIAVLGRGGLDIHDPAPNYTLKSLPGRFSGMSLVCLMYTGSRMIEPDLDSGIDFSKEYEEAQKMFRLM